MAQEDDVIVQSLTIVLFSFFAFLIYFLYLDNTPEVINIILPEDTVQMYY